MKGSFFQEIRGLQAVFLAHDQGEFCRIVPFEDAVELDQFGKMTGHDAVRALQNAADRGGAVFHRVEHHVAFAHRDFLGVFHRVAGDHHPAFRFRVQFERVGTGRVAGAGK